MWKFVATTDQQKYVIHQAMPTRAKNLSKPGVTKASTRVRSPAFSRVSMPRSKSFSEFTKFATAWMAMIDRSNMKVAA